jgi:PAS domain S-box-containing protein
MYKGAKIKHKRDAILALRQFSDMVEGNRIGLFEMLVRIIPDLVCVVTRSGRFRVVNDKWHSVLGYSESEIIGEKFMNFVHPEDRRQTEAEFERLLNGEEVIGFKNRYIDRQGRAIDFEWSAGIEKESGYIIGIARPR